MATIKVTVPSAQCSACNETREAMPRMIAHVSQIEDPTMRQTLSSRSVEFVATNFDPPPNWLFIDLHVAGKQKKAALTICPVCQEGEAIVVKAVLDTLRKLS